MSDNPHDQMPAFNEGGVINELHKAGIPLGMQPGIVNYLCDGIKPGSFLQAVLTNDFMGAFSHADNNNIQILDRYAAFLRWGLPDFKGELVWGSEQALKSWVEYHRIKFAEGARRD